VEWELKGFLESFNRMSVRLEELIFEVYERDLTKHKLELQMLRTQINPHFFYNTLEALRMNCMLGNEKDNIRMIEYLSTILRYGISSDNRPVLISEEVENLKYYSALHNLRSDTQINLQVFIIPDLLFQESIRLMFQPIVENAINHGVSPLRELLTIQIMGYIEDGNAVFTISDNGIGISHKDTEYINRCLDGNESGSKMGIGLKNVHRRIQLHFGDSYGLYIRANPGHGTQVVISIPLQKGGGTDADRNSSDSRG
jgi:two-component system sensor histidine kinase YesM